MTAGLTLRALRKKKWLCSVAPSLTLYLKAPPDGAQAIAALTAYQNVCPPDRLALITGTHAPGYARWDAPFGRELFATHTRLMDRRKDAGLGVWDGRTEDTWSFSIRGVPHEDVPRAPFCQALFPNDTDPSLIVRLATDLAEALPFRSGHAGITALFDADQKFDAFDVIYAWAKRHPGLEVEDLNVTLPHVLDALKGANWLTLVGHELWNRLGHAPTFSPLVRVTTSRHGMLLQAGDAPLLGRRNAAEIPPLYAEVERALQPIKLVAHGEFAARFEERGETLPWLYRFLRPNDW